VQITFALGQTCGLAGWERYAYIIFVTGHFGKLRRRLKSIENGMFVMSMNTGVWHLSMCRQARQELNCNIAGMRDRC
jgi:hypothetical protein